MKYIDEIRRICSISKLTIPAHGSVSVQSADQYIPAGYLGILDPLKIYQRDGIYGKRKILKSGNNKITVRLENRTSHDVYLETGCYIAKLRLLDINKLIVDEETE